MTEDRTTVPLAWATQLKQSQKIYRKKKCQSHLTSLALFSHLYSKETELDQCFNPDFTIRPTLGASKNAPGGRGQWLIPVTPALWEARWVDYLRSGVLDQPGQHDEPCLY